MKLKLIILNKFKALYRTFKYRRINKKGDRIKTRIIVFESDDWGSIRTASKKVKDNFLGTNEEFTDYFLKMDTLETINDVNKMFDILRKYKDTNGNHPKITANFAVCNPKFESIDILNKKYFRETIIETYNNYFGNSEIINTFKKGIKEGLFLPQLHCLEHLNVHRWIDDLNNNIKSTKLAFDNKMVGIQGSFTKDNPFAYMDELHCRNEIEDQINCQNIVEAIKIFENIFGYKSESFTPSCYVWTDMVEKILKENDVNIIQCAYKQNLPIYNSYEFKYKKHFFGKTKNEMYFSLRNCSFEPATNNLTIEENVKLCMKQIEIAFKMKKPAIISMHRINFVSSIDEKKYNECIQGFDSLLKEITNKYKNVVFMDTLELYKYISTEKR